LHFTNSSFVFPILEVTSEDEEKDKLVNTEEIEEEPQCLPSEEETEDDAQCLDSEQSLYEHPPTAELPTHKNKYWLARIVFLRYLAFIYLVAFLVAFQQNDSLIGENGLTPAVKFLARYKECFSSSKEGFLSHPTLFWFAPPTTKNLQYMALVGITLSFYVMLTGCANALMMFLLWIAYFSIVNVGQTWYSFGWESQLLEAGFLAIFLVPYFHLQTFPTLTPTPWVVIWGNRWCMFRLMLGAGLIKIRGDKCWKDLTAMKYHYQTQPVPNQLSSYFHNSPRNATCKSFIFNFLNSN
jgi:hypothetical protein